MLRKNYDGQYKGTIPIRKAFAESRNIPAVKVLAMVGIPNLIPYVRRFGITSKIDPYLPTALGAADITLLEMTSAYTTFPNDGVRVVPKFVQKVTDYDRNVLKENLPELKDVISAETARTMVDLLQEPVRQGTAVKLQEMKRPCGRQDRNHERLYRCLVYWVYAFPDHGSVGWI
jgi:penicillin-binding protein 1A